MPRTERDAFAVIGAQSHARLKLAASWVMELSGRVPKAHATAHNAAETDDLSDVGVTTHPQCSDPGKRGLPAR